MRRVALLAVALVLCACAACGAGTPSGGPPAPVSPVSPAGSGVPASPARPMTSSTPTPRPTPTLTPEPSPAPSPHETDPDPRWRFFTDDKHWYTSAWFAGTHRIMIGFGCNASPWYDHDPHCPGREGFHHGIDVAMPCNTPLYAGLPGTVLAPSAPGTPGPAYGVNPVRLRIVGPGGPHDVLIGHTRTVYVHPGERVHAGERIALASNSGAPDGCHLHFEVRPPGGDYTAAVDPSRWLSLRPWRP